MNETLQRWRKVCAAATEGPWVSDLKLQFIHPKITNLYNPNAKNDYEFIALSRTALPVAIDCLEMALEGLKCFKKGYEGHLYGPCGVCKQCETKIKIHARLEQVK